MGSLNKNSSTQRKLALVIGNDDYNQPSNKLNQSVKNVNELTGLLESIEFQVTKEINVGQEIIKRIKAFDEKFKIESDDLVFFYFSGHACQCNDENWLIPTDDSHITGVDDVESYGTAVHRILQRLSGPKDSPCTVICILDCCKPYSLGTSSASNSE